MKKLSLSHIHFRPGHMSFSSIWIIGIVIAFIGMFAVALSAAILFFGIFDADTSTSTMAVDMERISREDLMDAVRIIDERTRNFDRLRTTPPALPDPSL